jgi:hypothetical protein
VTGEQFDQHAVVRRVEVLNQDEGLARSDGQGVQQSSEGVKAARRRA